MMKDCQSFLEPVSHPVSVKRGEVRLRIVEGVPGSGKTILLNRLRRELHASTKRVITYSEEALLFSWQHWALLGIDRTRLSLMEAVLSHIEETLAADHEANFLLERFHLTFALLNRTPGLDQRYDGLVERLRRLPIQVILVILEPDEIDSRARHPERAAQDRAWARFLEERLAASPETSLGEIYLAQQRTLLENAEAQGIEFRVEHISVAPSRHVVYEDE